jgi:hypothetical protein
LKACLLWSHLLWNKQALIMITIVPSQCLFVLGSKHGGPVVIIWFWLNISSIIMWYHSLSTKIGDI